MLMTTASRYYGELRMHMPFHARGCEISSQLCSCMMIWSLCKGYRRKIDVSNCLTLSCTVCLRELAIASTEKRLLEKSFNLVQYPGHIKLCQYHSLPSGAFCSSSIAQDLLAQALKQLLEMVATEMACIPTVTCLRFLSICMCLARRAACYVKAHLCIFLEWSCVESPACLDGHD